jgi:hypothetical protein
LVVSKTGCSSGDAAGDAGGGTDLDVVAGDVAGAGAGVDGWVEVIGGFTRRRFLGGVSSLSLLLPEYTRCRFLGGDAAGDAGGGTDLDVVAGEVAEKDSASMLTSSAAAGEPNELSEATNKISVSASSSSSLNSLSRRP